MPKLTAPELCRRRRSERIGPVGGPSKVPVCWLTSGSVQRGHGLSMRSVVSPTLTQPSHASSSNGAQPLISILGRKRSADTGGRPCAARCALSAATDASHSKCTGETSASPARRPMPDA
eukprot:6189188-Pleurochrysis_carterae.AAC.3